MYAIVRCGGRQEKASVDDVLTVDKLSGEVGASVTLPALLVVDGAKVIARRRSLGLDFRFTARGQVLAELQRRSGERQGRHHARRGTKASSRQPKPASQRKPVLQGNEAFL